MGVVIPSAPNVGDQASASFAGQLVSGLSFLSLAPIARLRQSVAQTLTTGVAAAITFDTSDVDSYAGHSNTVNNSRYTSQANGYYWVWGEVFHGNNATGIRRAALYLNGVEYVENNIGAASGSTTGVTVAAIVPLNVGSYVELWGLQSSGAGLATYVAGGLGSSLNVMWIHN